MAWAISGTISRRNPNGIRPWGGYLYVGTDAGKIYRSSDGSSFNLVYTDAGGTGSICDFHEFGSYLYASDTDGRIHRTNDGTTWANVEDLSAVTTWAWTLEVFGSNIYVSGGTTIHRSSDGLTWDLVLQQGSGDHIHTIKEFGSYIYAVWDNTVPGTGIIFRSPSGDLSSWVNVETLADGEDDCRTLAVFDSKLFGNFGGKIKSSSNGLDYSDLQDITNWGLGSFADGTAIYFNTYTGSKIYKSIDGVTFVEDADLIATSATGLGDMNVFDGYIYCSGLTGGNIYSTLISGGPPTVSPVTINEKWSWHIDNW